jgi:hypothetical protein
MNINTDLIYTGQNFNLVLDCAQNAEVALETLKKVLVDADMGAEAENFEIDLENCKIYLTEGSLGNGDTIVKDICVAVANELKNCSFYGHAFYDDENCGYESCADYEYESGYLKITLIESPEGNGCCPECGEQIVCFDEYEPSEEYTCEECGAQINDHSDMFGGTLPTVTIYEEKIL